MMTTSGMPGVIPAGAGLESFLVACVFKTVALLLAAGLASLLLHRAAAATRHLVWFVALVGAAMLPLLTLVTPEWRLALLPSGGGMDAPATSRSSSSLRPAAERSDMASGKAEEIQAGVSSAESNRGASGNAQRTGWGMVIRISLLVWGLGTAAVLLYLAAGVIFVTRLARGARELEEGPLLSVVREVLSELDWPHRVRVCQSDRVSLPITWGALRPVVLLPVAANSWPGERQRMVLLHELAHVQRRDCLTQFIGRLAAALYWFNPLLWVALRRLRIERERACDDLVLGAGSPASSYANHLLEVARGVRAASLAAAAGIPMAKPSQLERRLLAILDSGRSRRAMTRGAVWVAWLGLTTLLLPLAALQLTRAEAGLTDGLQTPQAERLRYSWRPGASYVYSVNVEASGEDSVETVTGNLVYTVRAADENGATLAYHSQLTPKRPYKPGRSGPPPLGLGQFWAGARAHIFGAQPEMRLDATGKLLESSGRSTALPQALGDVERLVFEPLSPQGRDSWEISSQCEITYETTVPLSPMSGIGSVEKKSLPAREKTNYRLANRSANAVEIRKRYELKTEEKAAGQARMQLIGEGTITLDTAAGVPRAMEFKGTFTEATENTTRRTPIVVSYRLLDGAGKEEALQQRVVARVEPQEMTASEMRLTLADLRAKDWGRRHSAAARFGRAKPSEPGTEVVNALLGALTDPNSGVRQNVIRALGVWGGDAAVEPLIKILDDPEFSVRWAAIEALGAMQVPAAAQPLAKHLAVQQDAGSAARALQEIGAPAESAVLEVLNGTNQNARREACRVLKALGTQRSLVALEKAAADGDGLTALLAQEALRAVMARGTKP